MLQSIALLLFCQALAAQVSVGYAPTGAESVRSYLGRRVPGVAVWSVVVCNEGHSAIAIPSAGLVHAGIASGAILFPEPVIDVVAARAQGRTRSQRLAEIGEALSLLAGVLTGGAKRWTASLIGTAGLLHELSANLRAREPDFGKVRALVLPDIIEVQPSGCWSGVTLGGWTRASKPVNVRWND